MTIRTGNRTHYLGDFLPDIAGLSLPETAFQVIDDALKFGLIGAGSILVFPHHPDAFSLGTVENSVQLFFGQLLDRRVQ